MFKADRGVSEGEWDRLVGARNVFDGWDIILEITH